MRKHISFVRTGQYSTLKRVEKSVQTCWRGWRTIWRSQFMPEDASSLQSVFTRVRNLEDIIAQKSDNKTLRGFAIGI